MGTCRIRKHGDEFTLFFRKVSPFSNHHPIDFPCSEAINSNGEILTFSCSEQFYMYNKAVLFDDNTTMKEILESRNPKQMKKLACPDGIKGWDEKIWNKHKDDVMRKGCFAKFQSAQHLRFVLFLSTGSQILECSPFDRYWGIGIVFFVSLSSYNQSAAILTFPVDLFSY